MSIYMYNTKHSLNKQTKSKTKLCSAKPKHLTSSGWLAGSSLTTGCRALLFDFLAASGQSWRIRTGVSHGICIVNSCRTSRVWLFLHFDINPHVPLSWIPHPFHSSTPTAEPILCLQSTALRDPDQIHSVNLPPSHPAGFMHIPSMPPPTAILPALDIGHPDTFSIPKDLPLRRLQNSQ